LDEVSEVLLIEDNSPDDSLAVCQALAREYNKVKLLRHPDGGNHGAGASRNLGIRHARCDYIAFLDADDWYLPNRFKTSLPILESQPDVDGVFETGGVEFEDEEVRRLWLSRGGVLLNTFRPEVQNSGLLQAFDEGTGSLQTNAITIRRSVIDRVGLFDEDLHLLQDTALWWKMAMTCRLVPGEIAEPVTVRLVHKLNRSSKHWTPERVEARRKLWLTLWKWCKARNLDFAKRKLVLRRLVAIEMRGMFVLPKVLRPIESLRRLTTLAEARRREWALTPAELLYAYYHVSGVRGLAKRLGRLLGVEARSGRVCGWHEPS
jgi:GT2 family glycosyltransferase